MILTVIPFSIMAFIFVVARLFTIMLLDMRLTQINNIHICHTCNLFTASSADFAVIFRFSQQQLNNFKFLNIILKNYSRVCFTSQGIMASVLFKWGVKDRAMTTFLFLLPRWWRYVILFLVM
jgi:hypothetical protein